MRGGLDGPQASSTPAGLVTSQDRLVLLSTTAVAAGAVHFRAGRPDVDRRLSIQCLGLFASLIGSVACALNVVVPPGFQSGRRLFVVLGFRQRIFPLRRQAFGADERRADFYKLAVAETRPLFAATDNLAVATSVVELPRLGAEAVTTKRPGGSQKVGVKISTVALARRGVQGDVDRDRIAPRKPAAVLHGERFARVGGERGGKGDLPFSRHRRVAPPLCGFGSQSQSFDRSRAQLGAPTGRMIWESSTSRFRV